MSDVERCAQCGYSRGRHPMRFPEAPWCTEFQTERESREETEA